MNILPTVDKVSHSQPAGLDYMPYKGLMPYEEVDAAFFFGREKWRDIIINNLRASRLTVLYGGSGVGKSSVLRAGVVHTLQQIAIQNSEQYGAPKIAVTFFSSWRDEPLPLLRQQIEQDIKAALGLSELEPVSPSLPFDQALMEWSQRLGDETGDGKLFVILDQFEEYFLYHNHEAEECSFATEFPRAVNRSDLPVNFLISLRQDSLYRLDRFKEAIPSLGVNRLHLDHLDEDAASDAIRKPVKEFNRRYRQEQPPISVEPALVQLVLDQVRTGRLCFGEKGRGGVEMVDETSEERPIETPFLQMVMTRLWHEEMAVGSHRLRKETLERLGGATQIVKEHLDARMAELTAEEQHAAAHIFNYLVTPSGTKISQTVDDLVRYVNEEGDGSVRLARSQVESLLENLCQGDSRILRPAATEADIRERYEIFHDVLADAILDWRRRYLERQKIEAEKAELEENQSKERERLRIEAEKERIKTQKSLLKRQKQATQRWTMALTGVAALALVGWGVVVFQALKVQKKIDIAQNNLEAKQVLVLLKTTDQLESLQSALKLGHRAIEGNYIQRATGPSWALQQILEQIHLKNMWMLPADCIATALGHSSDGRWVAVGDLNGRVCLWSLQKQRWMPFFQAENEQIDRIDLSRTGERIVTVTVKGSVSAWDHKGARIQEFGIFPKTGQRATDISLSPDGRQLAIVSGKRDDVILFDVETGNKIMSPYDTKKNNVRLNRIAKIEFNSAGNKIAIASPSSISIWDLKDKSLKSWDISGLKIGWISDLSFSPDEQSLATASSDGTPRLWNLNNPNRKFGELLWRFKGHEGAVQSIAFNPDGKKLLTGGSDGTARIWKMNELDQEMEWKQTLELSGHDSFISALSFSQDGQISVTATQMGTVRQWSLEDKNELIVPFPQILENDKEKVREKVRAFTQIVLSPDGDKLATASLGNIFHLWDLDGNMKAEFPKSLSNQNSPSHVRSQVFFRQLDDKQLADGNQIATISGDGTAELWNTHGKQVAVLFKSTETEQAIGLNFKVEKPRLVTVRQPDKSSHVELRIWDIQENQPTNPKSYPLGNENKDFVVASFSPDGRYLAIGFTDGKAYIIDLDAGNLNELKPQKQNRTRISSIDFSRDSQYLVTASWDGTATIWNFQGDRIKEIKHGSPIKNGSPIMSARFNSDGNQLVTVSWNNLAKIWDLQGNLLAEYRSETGLWDANFIPTPHGQQLVAVGWGAKGQIWPIKTLDELLDEGCNWMQDYLTAHPEEAKDLTFCND